MEIKMKVTQKVSSKPQTEFILDELDKLARTCNSQDNFELRLNVFCLRIARKINYYYFSTIDYGTKIINFHEYWLNTDKIKGGVV